MHTTTTHDTESRAADDRHQMSSANLPDDSGRRACDQCRHRKIRCDKESPCSNCRVASRACSSTGAGQKPREARHRVLISSQYEKKIDSIDHRLASIETLLRNLSVADTRPGPFSHTAVPSAHAPSEPLRNSAHQLTPQTVASSHEQEPYDSSDNESAYGGDTGLLDQTNFASEFLEDAVEKTSLSHVDPQMMDALASLRQMVELGKQRSISHGPRFPLQRPVPSAGITKLDMPPQHIVTGLLREHKNQPVSLCNTICATVAVTNLADIVRNIYFPTEDITEAQFIIANGGLYLLLVEVFADAAPERASKLASRDEFQHCLKLLCSNIETALLHMPLFQSTKPENVQALYLGTLYAIDMCRPSVAWQLLSTAAQLCQTGGYHRAECLACDTPELAQKKKSIFWEVYTLDKSLSLRLGRASVIQDYDISIPKVKTFHNLIPEDAGAGWNEVKWTVVWLKIADIQGRAYEQLYSPRALREPVPVIAARATQLAEECRSIESESQKTRKLAWESFRHASRSLMELFTRGDELQFFATACLIHRKIPVPPGSASRFSETCLETARKAMRLHQDCINVFGLASHIQSVYIHWNLMLTPFAPFFILFCYVIETSSPTDLTLLQSFAATLDLPAEASEPSRKFAKLCRVMVRVVTLYVEAKKRRLEQQADDENMGQIGQEFEMYLSQLGFMPGLQQQEQQQQQQPQQQQPQPQQPQAQQTQNGQPMPTMGGVPAGEDEAGFGFFGVPGEQMGDWFRGSMNMMGLVEEDLSGVGMGMDFPLG